MKNEEIISKKKYGDVQFIAEIIGETPENTSKLLSRKKSKRHNEVVDILKRIIEFREGLKSQYRNTLIIILIFLHTTCFSQIQDIKFAAYNVISSSVISGIGSGIHKKSNETFFHAFCNGAWKGSIGGVLNYTGMKIIQYSSSKNTYSYIWPARFTNSLGNSITINGINNKPILSSYNLTFYFANIIYDGKFHVKVDPYTLGSTLYFSFQNNANFNIKNTLLTGSVFFDKSSKGDSLIVDASDSKEIGTLGQNYGNTICKKTYKRYVYNVYHTNKEIDGKTYDYPVIKKSINDLSIQIVSHEIIHNFQYSKFYVLNYLIPNNYFSNLKVNKYLSTNLNFGMLYLIASINGYKNNVFENEADYFGNSKFDTNTIEHY